jgi:cytochrome o ubiquinol oxidase subunit II
VRKKIKIVFIVLIVSGFLGVSVWYLHHTNIPILEPAGPIAQKERNLIYFALGLSLIVVIPVFSLLGIFAYRYRESNTKARYSPELDHSRVAETAWWLIPSIIIFVLAMVAWTSSHTLNPYNPIASSKKTINIQVVALDWKWLFIYPGKGVASLNNFQIPVNTPINFEITSDTVMNSFWIPQLGGQIYAMPGMSTQLNLMASKNGIFNGSSANISGEGFSGMTFSVKASSYRDYSNWLSSLSSSSTKLNLKNYNQLAKPSLNNVITDYSNVVPNLYNSILYKYVAPTYGSNGGLTTVAIPKGESLSGMVM